VWGIQGFSQSKKLLPWWRNREKEIKSTKFFLRHRSIVKGREGIKGQSLTGKKEPPKLIWEKEEGTVISEL